MLSSVRDVVDSNGDLRIHRRFDAFGNIVDETRYNANGTLATPGWFGYTTIDFAYTGRPRDETTGLQNNLHRWYDPKVGRWMSEDPIGFAGWDPNLYRYVDNSPTDRVDSSGLWWHIIIGGVVGGVVGGGVAWWTGGDTQDIVGGVISGVVGGAVSAATFGTATATIGGVAGGAVSGGLGSAAGGAAREAADVVLFGDEFDRRAIVGDTMGGAVGGAVVGIAPQLNSDEALDEIVEIMVGVDVGICVPVGQKLGEEL